MNGPVLNTVRAAEYVGLKPQTLRKLKHEGKGPRVFKQGRLNVYYPADLDAWLQSTLTEDSGGGTRVGRATAAATPRAHHPRESERERTPTPGVSTTETAVSIGMIAEILHVSTDTAYRLARLGEIPGFKVGSEWRFFPSKVIAALEAPKDPWAQSRRSTSRPRKSAS